MSGVDVGQVASDAQAIYDVAFEWHGVMPIEDAPRFAGSDVRGARATAKLLEDGVAEIRRLSSGRRILHLITPSP